jgi:hypothetical protein
VYLTTSSGATSGAVTSPSQGAFALSFDGTQSLTIPAKAAYNTSAFSISFWIKPTNYAPDYMRVFYKCAVAYPCAGNDGWSIEINSTQALLIFLWVCVENP